jgi:hypothetical protein
MTAAEVVEAIERAFSGVQRDSDQSLHQAQLTDQGIGREISEAEWKASALLDTDSEWHEVPDDDLQSCDAALSHLTPASWRYYLPAYMRAALKQLATPLWKYDVPHWVLHSLTYDDEYPGMGPYKLARFEALNESQAEAVARFLKFTVASPSAHNFYSRDAKIALEKYWGIPKEKRPNSALMPDASTSPLRARRGAAKRER